MTHVTRSSLALIPLLFILAGCGSTPSNWSIVAPSTWFSHKPADKADSAKDAEQKAQIRVDDKTDAAVHAAAIEVFKASISANALTPGNAKDQTVRFIGNGMGLLQQVSPLTGTETSASTKIVAGLLSEEAEKRRDAEVKQQEAEGKADKLSKELEKLEADLDKAKGDFEARYTKLRQAFDVENAVANEYRSRKAWFWIASGIAILGILAALYVKLQLGGITGALGAGLARISKTNATAADLLRTELDTHLNRDEQERVKAAFIKHS